MCKRTMHKRARIPMFLWERHACSNSGAQAVFSSPPQKRPGNKASANSCGRGSHYPGGHLMRVPKYSFQWTFSWDITLWTVDTGGRSMRVVLIYLSRLLF